MFEREIPWDFYSPGVSILRQHFLAPALELEAQFLLEKVLAPITLRSLAYHGKIVATGARAVRI
jgi:hypothetical protein